MKFLMGLFGVLGLSVNSAAAVYSPNIIGLGDHADFLGTTPWVGDPLNPVTQGCSGDACGGRMLVRDGGSVGIINPAINNHAVFSTTGNALGGAIANFSSGSVDQSGYGIDVIRGDFNANRAISQDGNAFGGAIYNAGFINEISSSFTNNFARSDSGEARGGAIYSTTSLNIVADGVGLEFRRNYTHDDDRGRVYNAIYLAEANLSLNFDVRNGGAVLLDDQIEGRYAFNINITGDSAAGTTGYWGGYAGGVTFNNLIIGAREVRVENSRLTLGSINDTAGGYTASNTGAGDMNHGLFVSGWDSDYESAAYWQSVPASYRTDLTLSNSELVLDFGPAQANGDARNFLRFGAVNFEGRNRIAGGMDFNGADLNFHIADGLANTNYAVLSFGGGGNLNIAGSNVNIYGDVDIGDTIWLMRREAVGQGNLQGYNDVNINSDFGERRFDLSWDVRDASGMQFTVHNERAATATVSYTQAATAGTALVRQGGDLVANAGVSAAIRNRPTYGNTYGTFMTISGGQSDYSTGSNGGIDMQSFSMVAGAAVALTREITFAGFAEFGMGDFNTMGDFGARGIVDGGGRADYMGGGVIAHYRIRPRVFADASFRAGQLGTSLNNAGFSGEEMLGFDATTMYMGGHVGMGYVALLEGDSRLVSTIRYLYNVNSAHDAQSHAGSTIEFDSAWSHRVRADTTLTIGREFIRPFVGAGLEYEFAGDQHATLHTQTSALAVDMQSLRGFTGIGRAGFRTETATTTLELGLEGFVGVRDGWAGMLGFRHRFGVTKREKEAFEKGRLEEFWMEDIDDYNPARAKIDETYTQEYMRKQTEAVDPMLVTPPPHAAQDPRTQEWATGPYTVQTGAYYTEHHAEDAKARFGRHGNATIIEEDDMFKVQFRNLSAGEARRIGEALRTEEGAEPGFLRNGRWINANRI